MPATSLGYFRTQPTPQPPKPVVAAAVLAVTAGTPPTLTGVKAVRLVYFVACFTVGVWMYARPTDAVEAATTLDMSADLNQLLSMVAPVFNNLSATLNVTSAVPMDVSFVTTFSDALTVFVRVLATLLLVAAAGVQLAQRRRPHPRPHRFAVVEDTVPEALAPTAVQGRLEPFRASRPMLRIVLDGAGPSHSVA